MVLPNRICRNGVMLTLMTSLSLVLNLSEAFRLPVYRRNDVSRGLQSVPVPISGNYKRDGEYYLNLTIGGQSVSLLIDTGSSDLGVAAKGCNGCAKKDHTYYDPEKSPNAEALGCDWCSSHKTDSTSSSCKKRPNESEKQCTFRVSYEDTSGFSAALYEDDLTFGDELKSRSVVGAMYSANFPNPRSVDGIIGLADISESSSGATTAFSDLVAKGEIDDVFSLCLTSDGGVMYFGSDDAISATALREDDVIWTQRLNSSGFYAVEIEDVTVDGKSIDVPMSKYNDGDAIVDSGTSIVYFSSTAYKAIKSHFESLCSSRCLKGVCDCDAKKPLKNPIFADRCVQMSETERQAFPAVEIKFSDGARVAYDPDAYLRSGDTAGCDDGAYTISIDNGGSDGSGTILGDSFMMSYVVIHDRRGPKQRIGFVERAPGSLCP